MTRVQAIEEEIKSLSASELAELRDWLLAEELVIVPGQPEITLESLVEKITDDNRHVEIRTEPSAGNEAR